MEKPSSVITITRTPAGFIIEYRLTPEGITYLHSKGCDVFDYINSKTEHIEEIAKSQLTRLVEELWTCPDAASSKDS